MITLVCGDDWMGVYKDGECVYQNHSVDSSRLLGLAGIEHQSVYVDLNWLDQQGSLPLSLEDIVEE